MTAPPQASPSPFQIVALDASDADLWLAPAVHTYVTAMNYPRSTEQHRAPLWRDHFARPGWFAVGAVTRVSAVDALRPAVSRLRVDGLLGFEREILVGVAYGYRGARDQWWNQQLRSGLRRTGRTGDEITAITADYFELTELHVHPIAQGRGVGERLLTALLADRHESTVLLSTPEVPYEENRAWSLYRRLGFTDILRHFSFVGDPRPFAFLGRALPLSGPADPCRDADRRDPLAR
ncbi:GNAT family N-acetyltransferase [Gordonia liuliyuniae]|uniref:GNAT family N-acetyltransferase n=1 Tax=Gordonia liuliyuniae TaxID=2911517 RepID=A0ABS9IUS2_9ACTN|nr:GNAT family N-acetyltransferase [Gordonia liuliyuniae]MCF8589298.1 GNAT family N-acetyltransferase [Gordonia liuliyuniae]